jgi:hypothetical protein
LTFASPLASLSAQSPEERPGQSDKSDIPLAESKRISPFPPKDVQVSLVDTHAVIKWTKVRSDRVTGYDVYRLDEDGRLKKIGHTKELHFVDKRPLKGNATYAVASVDYNDNQSTPRQATAN